MVTSLHGYSYDLLNRRKDWFNSNQKLVWLTNLKSLLNLLIRYLLLNFLDSIMFFWLFLSLCTQHIFYITLWAAIFSHYAKELKEYCCFNTSRMQLCAYWCNCVIFICKKSTYTAPLKQKQKHLFLFQLSCWYVYNS
jgi:hypothetical protein